MFKENIIFPCQTSYSLLKNLNLTFSIMATQTLSASISFHHLYIPNFVLFIPFRVPFLVNFMKN